jgi:hypothetical protein
MMTKAAIFLLVCSWLCLSACGGDDDEKAGSACEQNCALNQCPKDAPAAECLSKCEMYVSRCPAETDAAAQCRIGLSSGKLVCDPDNGVTTYADPASCSTQTDALMACLSK